MHSQVATLKTVTLFEVTHYVKHIKYEPEKSQKSIKCPLIVLWVQTASNIKK